MKAGTAYDHAKVYPHPPSPSYKIPLISYRCHHHYKDDIPSPSYGYHYHHKSAKNLVHNLNLSRNVINSVNFLDSVNLK